MLRKFALAAIATGFLAIGLAAVGSTDASAQGRHHGGPHGGHHSHNHGGHRGHWGHNNRHWGGGPRFAPRAHYGFRPHYRPYVMGYGSRCIRQRWVPTPWGPQLRRVNVCY